MTVDEERIESPLCEGQTINIKDTVETWGLGRVCRHCTRPVRVTVEHVHG